MAYVLYTPPTHTGPSFTPGASKAKRAIGRIWGPLNVGYTQFRIDGVWAEKAVPTTDESLAADVDIDGTSLFLRGGHWHYIREEILEEIAAAGLSVGSADPFGGAYPSVATFPGSSTFPGVA